MDTLTPQRSMTQLRPVLAPSWQQPARRLSVMPRLLFLLAAAFMLLAPVIGAGIVDGAGGSRHLESAYVFLVGLAPFFAASAVILGLLAAPGRVVSRKLQAWIDVALGTLFVGVVGTVLAPFLASNIGSVSILGTIDVIVAYLGLSGYIVALVGTQIVDRRTRHEI